MNSQSPIALPTPCAPTVSRRCILDCPSDEIGLEIGADDYVTQPFSPRELVARIRVVLRRLAPARFELRQHETRLMYCGQTLEVTRYKYQLLKTLLECSGHVLARVTTQLPMGFNQSLL